MNRLVKRDTDPLAIDVIQRDQENLTILNYQVSDILVLSIIVLIILPFRISPDSIRTISNLTTHRSKSIVAS